MPTTTGLVHHLPMDYSVDDVKGTGKTIHGGRLVKQPRIGHRCYDVGTNQGLVLEAFNLGSYGNTWTICFWLKVINQDPASAFINILKTIDTTDDDAAKAHRNGFDIHFRNNAYNTKPLVDFRTVAVDNAGTALTITSAQADYGSSPSQNPYFNSAAGKAYDTWVHYAFQRTTATDYKFYVDGALVADIATTGTIAFPASTGLQIGGDQNRYYHNSHFLVDDLRFYSTAVTSGEIAKFAGVSLSTASGGIALTDLAPNEISVSKGQLVGVDVLETTASADTGCEKIQVQLVASA